MARMLDSNVLLDLVTGDAQWLDWSVEQFRIAAHEGAVLINPIIYAEIAPAFDSSGALDRWINPRVFRRLPLPYPAAFIAAQAFAKYRQRGGAKTTPLPDFYIGAHAQCEKFILVTRDTARYRTYFPDLTLITPESA